MDKKIKTKLKFVKSKLSGAWVAFVTKDEESGILRGVREDAKVPKQVCVAALEVAHMIEPGVLYDVVMVRMAKKNTGWVVIEAQPHEFEAKITTTVVKNALYKVEVKFGNKTILFDPLDGKGSCFKTVEGVVKILESRKDIKNLVQVIEDFRRTANIVLMAYESDGNYVKKCS